MSSRLTPGAVDEGVGDVLQEAAHQVGVGIDDDYGVPVPALGLLPHLVDDDVVHQGGLAHGGAGDVGVVPAQQVIGEVDLPGRAGRGVADMGAAPDAARRGQQRLRAWLPAVPQAGRLADSHHPALAEESRAGQVQDRRVGDDWPHLAHIEARSGGVVVVAVGRRRQQLIRPLGPRVRWQDRRHLKLGVEGDAGDLLFDEERVINALAGLLPPLPQPTSARAAAMHMPISTAFQVSLACTHR